MKWEENKMAPRLILDTMKVAVELDNYRQLAIQAWIAGRTHVDHTELEVISILCIKALKSTLESKSYKRWTKKDAMKETEKEERG